uniref:Uncharacterized protein n=1 Tax=Romanomermis culicivorax TaxID=13658 RepID=A0A915KMS5_ROMCU
SWKNFVGALLWKKRCEEKSYVIDLFNKFHDKTLFNTGRIHLSPHIYQKFYMVHIEILSILENLAAGKWQLHSASGPVHKFTDNELRKLCQDENWPNLAVHQTAKVRRHIFALRNMATGAVVVKQQWKFHGKGMVGCAPNHRGPPPFHNLKCVINNTSLLQWDCLNCRPFTGHLIMGMDGAVQCHLIPGQCN